MSILLQTTGDTVLKIKGKYINDDILIKIPKVVFTDLKLEFNDITGEVTSYILEKNKITSSPISIETGKTIYGTNATKYILYNSFLLNNNNIVIKGYGNINPDSIKKGINIFGTVGTYEKIKNENDNSIFLSFFKNKNIETYENNEINILKPGVFKNCQQLSSISTKNVESIGEAAFENDILLEAVDTDDLKIIKNDVFKSCSSLKNIDLSNAIEIGDNAFLGCTSLESIDIANVETLGSNAFSGCTSLSSVTLGNKFGSSINYCLFRSCSALTSISLPNTVKTITSSAFMGCKTLSNINTENIQYIQQSAFAGCTSLSSLNLTSLVDAAEYAFANCGFSNPLSVVSNLSIFKNYLFSGCKNIKTLNFTGKTNVELKNGVFDGCSALESADIKDIKKFGDSCFGDCINLKDVDIPSTMTSIPQYAFFNCDSLEAFNLKNVTSVGSHAFRYCTNLKDINVSQLRAISSCAFQGCALETVSVSCSTIYDAFRECSSLSIADVTANILSGTFIGCEALKDITIHNVTKLSFGTFNRCTSLENIILDVTKVPTLTTTSSVFLSTPIMSSSYLGHFGSIYVPASLVDTFKGATNWAIIADRITTKTITFFIDGTEYTAEEGMTWGEWVDSEYNTDGFFESEGGSIWKSTSLYQMILSDVTSSSVILDGEQYSLHSIGGGD